MNLRTAIRSRPPAASAPRATGPLLQARQLSLGYARADGAPLDYVLRDFSLQLAAGEIVALLGPSGVGKSSLLRVLAGLQRAQSGDIWVQGRRLQGPDPMLGYIFQDPCLLPWLTLEENVAFGLDFRNQPRLTPQQRQQRVQQAISEVGLSAARSQYPEALSGGMAQRASLARGLARAPQILLLDEPFSALDPVTRTELHGLLLQIAARHKTAMVLVTHDIDEALLLAQRVLLIAGRPGQLVGQWQPKATPPRDAADPLLATQRLEILRTLRSAMATH